MNTIKTVVENGIKIIKFNKPKSKNAWSIVEIHELTKVLADDVNAKTTTLSVLTGSGDYFTSGLDMKAISGRIEEKDETYINEMVTSVEKLVEEIINYPKLLIAIVNGPAVGIGTTILPLCDYVYASKYATFQTPFVKLGINAEVCSSLTFPMIMGRSNATELLIFGKKIDVNRAKEFGLVGQIYENEDTVYKEIESIANLPSETVKKNKKLIIDNIKHDLLACSKRECEILKTTIKSDEFFNAVNLFLARKKGK